MGRGWQRRQRSVGHGGILPGLPLLLLLLLRGLALLLLWLLRLRLLRLGLLRLRLLRKACGTGQGGLRDRQTLLRHSLW